MALLTERLLGVDARYCSHPSIGEYAIKSFSSVCSGTLEFGGGGLRQV
jgi:hypothetical protein